MGRVIALFLATALALRLVRSFVSGMKKRGTSNPSKTVEKPWNDNRVEDGKYEDI